MPKELGLQLLILLTFAAAGKTISGRSEAIEASEELRLIACKCLSALFGSFAGSSNVQVLTALPNLPSLGQCITVVLDNIADGPSATVQLSAAAALDSYLDCSDDKEALASLFPGIISSLTKTLQRDSRSRRGWRVLEASLRCLTKTLRSMLHDDDVLPHVTSAASTTQPADMKISLTQSWLKATAGQIKLALTTVVKIQEYGRAEVRQALLELCKMVLECCQKSLPECTTLAVETAMGLSWELQEDEKSQYEQSLERLAIQNSLVIESIKSSQHAWVTSLPRIVQSNDDKAKSRIIHQISTSIRVLSDLRTESNFFNDHLMMSLRGAVSAAISGRPAQVEVVQLDNNLDSTRGLSEAPVTSFSSVLSIQKSQQETLSKLQVLSKTLSVSSSGVDIATTLAESLRSMAGNSGVASFWLALNMVKHSLGAVARETSLFELPPDAALAWTDVLDILYSHSLSIFESTLTREDEEDWRFQGLALETIALQAQQMRSDFRAELIDALYPVVHFIGSSNAQLRHHAVVCLNIVAQSSGYESASRLIIDNVDYLVNTVALKLNTFELSPQAPQVLLMMMRLAGPSLLPFLDDLMASIFAALDSFHGYPRLVELLFSVLREIVVQGSRADTLMITSGREDRHRKTRYRPLVMAEVAELLEKSVRRQSERKSAEKEDRFENKSFPREPSENLFSAKPPVPMEQSEGDLDSLEVSDETDEGSQEQPAVEQKPDPPSKTYNMLQSIARLSQHYLTHESARLRRDLLDLTSTASAALQQNEDSFLPLVNDLWPVMARRLYDQEPFVVVSAAKAVASICMAAGDFMSSRLETEWPRLKALYWQVYPEVGAATKPKAKRRPRTKQASEVDLPVRVRSASPSAGLITAISSSSRNPSTSTSTSASATQLAKQPLQTSKLQIHAALIDLFVATLEYVHVNETIFDDVVDMFADLLPARKDLQDVLAARNPDAVWLVLHLQQTRGRLETETSSATATRNSMA